MTDKNFFFYVADISGSPVIGETDFSVVLRGDTGDLTGASSLVTEDDYGYYKVAISGLQSPVSGIVELNYDGVNNYIVSPDWAEFDIESAYTLDDIYSTVFASTVTPVVIDTQKRFGTVTLTVKDGDDWIDNLQVPTRFLPLTSWTNFTVKVYPATRLTDSSVVDISGTSAVTVVDDLQGLIEVYIDDDITTGVVPDGVANINLYADVQGIDPNGNRRTLIEITYNARRDFNE
jgi:hypothetical protein